MPGKLGETVVFGKSEVGTFRSQCKHRYARTMVPLHRWIVASRYKLMASKKLEKVKASARACRVGSLQRGI